MLKNSKIPPQATDIEELVLGAVMLEKNAFKIANDKINSDVFYKESNRKIYLACENLNNKDLPIDILTVCNELKRINELEAVGGALYVSQLTNRIVSAQNIEFHCAILLQKYLQRKLISVTANLYEKCFDDSNDIFDLMDEAERELTKAQNIYQNGQNIHISEYADQAEKQTIDRILSVRSNKCIGISTGLKNLDKMTGGFIPETIVVAARPSMGKCLGYGTKILMFDGSIKEVQNIKIGDKLMGDDSTPRNVLSTTTGKEMMYYVYQNKGITYRVNGSHILSLKRSRNDNKHKKGDILNISVNDYNNSSDKFKSNYKGWKTGVEFTEKHTEIPPYLLGVWLGDGNSRDCRISKNDIELENYLKKYADIAGLNFNITHDAKKCNVMRISRKKRGSGYSLVKELRKLNLLKNKHIPENYLINSRTNRLELLAGLLDTDGYNNKEGVFEIIQKSEKLAKQIKFLCDTLGFRVSIRKVTKGIKSINFVGEYWRLFISGDLHNIPTKINRKKAKQSHCIREVKHTGIKVVKDKIDNYYGFEIDGNKLFLLEDCTVTHNTALMLNFAKQAAKTGTVKIYELEMSGVRLTDRLIMSESNTDIDRYRSGYMNDDEFMETQAATEKIKKLNIFIDDKGSVNADYICRDARATKNKHKDLSMIIIDHCGLLEMNDYNRNNEIGKITSKFHKLRKELNIPVIMLFQLNRQVESRTDKKPQLSDLRDSGSIEQDADTVLLLYRPAYYDITVNPKNKSLYPKNYGEIIIAKRRDGKVGTVPFIHNNGMTKFYDYDEYENNNEAENKVIPKQEFKGERPF
ncbi:MAG TPA: replicative DNA helicase [Clostridiales bacterium]|nr:replicative DNA helicase [Clostridiales bacterium]